MPQTILYEVQEACKQLSLPVPVEIFGSQDETALLMGSVASAAGVLINGLREWQFQCAPVTFAGDGTTQSFPLPGDFDRFVDGTGWSVLNQWPVSPVDAQTWAALRARIMQDDLMYTCRLLGGKLEFLTPVISGDTVRFEYVRKPWVTDADDPSVQKEVVTKNGDVPSFDWLTMVLAIKVKWREAKGFETTAAMSDLLDRIGQNANADVMGRTLSLVPGRTGVRYIDPVYNLPSGGFGGP